MKFKINNQKIEILSSFSGDPFTQKTIDKINELIKALGTPISEPKNLIGKKIKGFKFEDTDACPYWQQMNNCLGKMGTIVQIHCDGDYKVEFADTFWSYPASEIEKHILPDDYLEWSVENLKEGDGYWTIDGDGDVYSTTYGNWDERDNWNKSLGHVFETQQDAINYKENKINK